MKTENAGGTKMASASSIPQFVTIEEYLASSYEPDLEYVDGVLEEKNMGTWEHGSIQIAIGSWFFSHRLEWRIDVASEVRTRTSGTRVRLPDICVIRRDGVVEQVRTTPPLLCIEILSPDDRPVRVMKRLDDFLAMGAENIWIVDPADRSAATYTRSGMKRIEGTRLEVAGTPIYLDLATIFADLDQDASEGGR
jgi:Uma2 family endonuclease